MAGTKVSSHVIADNIALGGNPTTTTQSAGNNTTRIATTAFVTGALADLSDSAPSTLNTLNELAAALGDDANFSTTVTNSIATKLPLAGGTMTGALNMGSQNITAANRISTADGIADTGAAGSSTIFNESGSTADFRIESDSNTHMFFLDGGLNKIGIGKTPSTWFLDVDSTDGYIASFDGSNDTGIVINSSSGSGDVIGFSNSGNSYNSVNIRGASGTGLVVDTSNNVGIGNTNPSGMHSNANNLVVGTGSGDQGMSVYAGTSTGRYAFARALGNNTDAYDGGMAYDGNRNLTFHTNAGTERMVIDGSGMVGIGADPAFLGLSGSGTSRVLHVGGTNSQLRLTNSILHHDNSGNTILHLRNNYGATSSAAQTKIESGFTTFHTGTSFTERMRIVSNGTIHIGTGGNNEANGSTGGCSFSADSSDRRNFICATTGTGTLELIEFRNPNGTVGDIKTSGSSTSYNTSSDYRLKENVEYTWDATSRLKQLKPARFNFIADDSNTTLDGFLAHEVQDIVPAAVSGEKDGEKMQGIDHSKLVPLLVKTIQELEARIATLEG